MKRSFFQQQFHSKRTSSRPKKIFTSLPFLFFAFVGHDSLNPLVITIEDIGTGLISISAGLIAGHQAYLKEKDLTMNETLEFDEANIIIAAGIGLCTSIATWKLLQYLIPAENFHPVEKGKLYRSAQLTPERLAYHINEYGIKTIINLRGKDEGELWWQEEASIAKQLGVALYDIAMSADELTPKEKLLQLLTIYESAEKPILIHCYSGRDRTGEAAAIWVLEMMGLNIDKALEQLAFIPYLHIHQLHPAKSFLIAQWRGKDWLINQYNEADYPKF